MTTKSAGKLTINSPVKWTNKSKVQLTALEDEDVANPSKGRGILSLQIEHYSLLLRGRKFIYLKRHLEELTRAKKFSLKEDNNTPSTCRPLSKIELFSRQILNLLSPLSRVNSFKVIQGDRIREFIYSRRQQEQSKHVPFIINDKKKLVLI